MGLVTIAASSALVLGACGGGDGTAAHHQGGTAQGGGSPGVGKSSSCAAASDVLSNTQSYAGKQVTVTGKIDRVVGPHAFTVAATNPSTSGNNSNAQGSATQSLLAVDKESTALTPGSPVELTGTLQPTFDANQAAVFAGGNLDRAAFTAYNGQPYVQAVFAGPESANLARSDQSGIVNGGNSGSSCAAANDVLSNTQSYAGKQVTVTGKVDRVVGPHAFTVAATNPSTSGNNSNAQGSATQSLLAVDKESTALTPGSPVELTGTLQPTFDANQAAVVTGGNLDPTAFTAYNGRPYVQAVFAGPVSANLTGAQANNGG